MRGCVEEGMGEWKGEWQVVVGGGWVWREGGMGGVGGLGGVRGLLGEREIGLVRARARAWVLVDRWVDRWVWVDGWVGVWKVVGWVSCGGGWRVVCEGGEVLDGGWWMEVEETSRWQIWPLKELRRETRRLGWCVGWKHD